MQVALQLVALAAGAAALTEEYVRVNEAALWASFKAEHGRVYTGAEEATRRRLFVENVLKAAAHGAANPRATFGVNKFSDISAEEFAMYTGGAMDAAQEAVTAQFDVETAEAGRAENVVSDEEAFRISNEGPGIDWREHGAVTAVKCQFFCGSCWAFSAIAALESQNALFGSKQLVALSEQELVSCMGGNGCLGGRPDRAWNWLIFWRKGQSVTEAAYPYTSVNMSLPQAPCLNTTGMPVGAEIKAKKYVPHHSEDQMAAWMQANGPFSVVVDSHIWMSYTGGVLTNCPGTRLNHAVTAVGFGVDYWIIKNSWGTDWGEGGYIRIGKGTNQCNVTHFAMAPKPRQEV